LGVGSGGGCERAKGAPRRGAATSADATAIAFDRLGAGPPLIIVAGAFKTRSTAPLAAAMQERF
jgi:hypothetical protein